nr:hypothetical protein [uncultured Chryseobacterium sp.]
MKRQKTLFLLFLSLWASAQEKKTDSIESAHSGCSITQTREKLDKRFFASTPPLELRVNNEKYTYVTLQFGKRKKKIYLYIRILEDNICIKKDKNVDLHFNSGEIVTLKNEYPVNCDSFFARQLKKRELQKLRDNEITSIKIYTYEKNFELYINETQNREIRQDINCLLRYKIKKTAEVRASHIQRDTAAIKQH